MRNILRHLLWPAMPAEAGRMHRAKLCQGNCSAVRHALFVYGSLLRGSRTVTRWHLLRSAGPGKLMHTSCRHLILCCLGASNPVQGLMMRPAQQEHAAGQVWKQHNGLQNEPPLHLVAPLKRCMHTSL